MSLKSLITSLNVSMQFKTTFKNIIISLLWTDRILILIFLKIDLIIYECLMFILTHVILLNNKVLEENIVIINNLLFYYQ